jgi:hypothetical protein
MCDRKSDFIDFIELIDVIKSFDGLQSRRNDTCKPSQFPRNDVRYGLAVIERFRSSSCGRQL